MNTVTILILFMAIVVVYVALISVFSTLFQITGLAKDKARFQTISLLTGVGFTTAESETVTNNPLRRKLAIVCMFVGHLLSIVILSLVVDTIAFFDIANLENSWEILLISFGAFAAIIIVFNFPFIKKPINSLIKRIGFILYFKKGKENVLTMMDRYDKESIYQIKINVLPENLKDKTLFKSKLKEDYNINVMLIRRDNRNITISKSTMIQEGDTVVVFGNSHNINTVFGTKHPGAQKEELNEAKLRNAIHIMENYQDKAMVEIMVHKVPEILKETTLYNSSIKGQYGINIMLIKRKELIIDINQDTTIEVGDTLVLFGPYKNIEYLFDNEEPNK